LEVHPNVRNPPAMRFRPRANLVVTFSTSIFLGAPKQKKNLTTTLLLLLLLALRTTTFQVNSSLTKTTTQDTTPEKRRRRKEKQKTLHHTMNLPPKLDPKIKHQQILQLQNLHKI